MKYTDDTTLGIKRFLVECRSQNFIISSAHEIKSGLAFIPATISALQRLARGNTILSLDWSK